VTQPAKPQPQPASTPSVPSAADPYPPYRRVYAWLFQAWLIMFLGVICCALIFYLLSYLPH
jgi:hypothetical protein